MYFKWLNAIKLESHFRKTLYNSNSLHRLIPILSICVCSGSRLVLCAVEEDIKITSLVLPSATPSSCLCS
jgi:hypothetical protein